MAVDSRRNFEDKLGISTYRLCPESKQFIRPQVHMLSGLWHNRACDGIGIGLIRKVAYLLEKHPGRLPDHFSWKMKEMTLTIAREWCGGKD